MDLQGQAAIVTGGASGLGAATATALARRGAKVAAFDLNGDAATAHARTFGGQGFGCDVRRADSLDAAMAAARAAHGPARILVNCAGIAPPGRAVGRDGPLALDKFEAVIGVNLIGTFNAIRLAAADMQKMEPLADGERGVIINTASIAAFDGQIGQVAYAASKAGVVGMTLPLAREFAQSGIRVMTIAPGIFATPMLRGLSEEVQRALAADVPFPKRLGTPEDYASLALHIIDSPMLNGEVIRIDGALRMAPK